MGKDRRPKPRATTWCRSVSRWLRSPSFANVLVVRRYDGLVSVRRASRIFERLRAESRDDTLGERRRAKAEVAKHLALLLDAVDHARSIGIPWDEVSARLGLDPHLAQAWMKRATDAR